jgi:dTDP-4-dehydrorhamnose 3,5-epimerase
MEEIISYSSKGVLRGMHLQLFNPQAKLINVIRGRIFDVIVDLRKDSLTFGQHASVILNGTNKTRLYIPKGFAHGFSVLSASADVLYKCDHLYNKQSESGIVFNDQELSIDWRLPATEMIVSEKDLILPTFRNTDANF